MKRHDPGIDSATVKWSLPIVEICLCQVVVAPILISTCEENVMYEEDELWFIDEPGLLQQPIIWEMDITDELLQRAQYCGESCI